VDEIFGGSIPQNFRPAVEKGIQDARHRGYLAGYPVVDFRVVLLDGMYHDVDSSEIAFKLAAIEAFKQGILKSKPVLLEPIMLVDVITPENVMGQIIGDLNSRRGQIESNAQRGSSRVIRAYVPLAEMFGYATAIRSLSQGRAAYSMEPARYDRVPPNIAAGLTGGAKR
jgi:elongation factor G